MKLIQECARILSRVLDMERREKLDMVSLENLLLLKPLQSFRSEETSMSFVCERSGTLLSSWSLCFFTLD